ncbi:MAG: dUTP diphosphatase [Negativicutes bacterium]|jgi:dUTP pyrophosphatase
MKLRGFELVEKYFYPFAVIPCRKTKFSAGYDFAAAVTVTIEPHKIGLVPTGIKAYMQPDEYLGLHIRSGLALKSGLMLANSQGIIDSDYYNNVDNEGHVMIALVNMSDFAVTITAGERIAQGIFYKYLIADDDQTDTTRNGGFGSTGKK